MVRENISPQDISDVAQGPIRLALYEDGPFLFLLCKPGESEWTHTPFSWHKLSNDDKVCLDEESIMPFEHLFRIVLTDTNGNVAAERKFVLDEAFAMKMHEILLRQSAVLFNAHSFMKHLNFVYNRLEISDMIKLAQAHFKREDI